VAFTVRENSSQSLFPCIFNSLFKDQSRCFWLVEPRSHVTHDQQGRLWKWVWRIFSLCDDDVWLPPSKTHKVDNCLLETMLRRWEPRGITDACYTRQLEWQAYLEPHNLLLPLFDCEMLHLPCGCKIISRQGLCGSPKGSIDGEWC
jgi:hypothetical protein